MASLIEELISTLKTEEEIYKELLPISEEKTKIIIQNDLGALQEIVELEQLMIEKLTPLERKRAEVIANIETVLNKKPGSLDLKTMIELFEKQPKEQRELSLLHDSLKATINRLVDINDRNKSLIEQSLEMIEFNMNLIQSTRMSPGTNNYTKGAAQAGMPISQTGMFDAKQ
ncbi:flagellar protein FlgN [Clostridium sp. Marseille-P299]|uniref:flagellar protein FlgN n=1 Tax=Clostridium sp. Marseille-P299 TaxID=1805477 RepID=UPI00082A78C4|nr:flagellar protein FlgN [Clostridium sp. Marseille-P299]